MEFYKLIVVPRALKDLKPFPKQVVQVIWDAIKNLRHAPRPIHCKKLKGFHKNEHRLRVGDYRVLYEVLDSEKIVYVLRVLNRKDAYRSL